MKIKYIAMAAAVMAGMGLTSCNDWLKEEAPGTNGLDEFFTDGVKCLQITNGCYVPLQWEYGHTYFSEWFIGDIASDDALKGGQNLADSRDAYEIENFKVASNNGILLDYYRAKYLGIGRCNLALRDIPKVPVEKFDGETDAEKESYRNRMLGEAHFLRGIYYFQLVRVFGGVPLIDFVVDSSDKWRQPRATVDQIYDFICSDLEQAEKLLWNRSRLDVTELGRATRGAAQAYLCKVYMYRHDYDNAYKWGKKWKEEQYGTEASLQADYYANFTVEGQNSPESIFAIQYVEDPTSDYGADVAGFGATRGTFGAVLTRPRDAEIVGGDGWGFDHPTKNLYDAYETGDPRRDLTIGYVDPATANVETNYLGVNTYYNRKVAYVAEDGTFPSLSHATRGPLNYNLMRASDALLFYAEACVESGKSLADAKWALEEVRKRARAMQSDPAVLPAFPYGSYADNADGLRQAIRHERRVELAMEAHRFFDLVRWGIAADVLGADGSFAKTEPEEVREQMNPFIKGRNEIFPLPDEELVRNPMEQNPGY